MTTASVSSCPRCGGGRTASDRFCPRCGHSYVGAPLAPAVAPPPVAPPMMPVMPMMAPAYPMAAAWRCGRCGYVGPPLSTQRISAAGWVVFGLLLAFTLILFWIGLLIKETRAQCPHCRAVY